MSLLELANEILLIVASNLSTRDLISFHQLNHRLHSLLTPSLTRLMISRKDPLLLWAAQKGSFHLLRRLLDNGANLAYVGNIDDWPRKQLYLQRTALHIAAECGHVDFVKLLITEGADVNIYEQKTQQYGATPLHLASKRGHEAVALALIDGGAEIEKKDRTGATALHFAVKGGYEPLVRMLLEKGANVHTRDCYQTTPLQLAGLEGPVRRLLLDAGGSDIDKSGDASEGQSPTPSIHRQSGGHTFHRGWLGQSDSPGPVTYLREFVSTQYRRFSKPKISIKATCDKKARMDIRVMGPLLPRGFRLICFPQIRRSETIVRLPPGDVD